MPTYLVSNRPPTNYRPRRRRLPRGTSGSTASGRTWSTAATRRSRRKRSARASGRTKLGGYTLVDADDLDHALALVAGCPAVRAGGGAEVGELTIVNQGTAAVADEADGHGPRHVVVHETYLYVTADAVWWAHHNVSDWQASST